MYYLRLGPKVRPIHMLPLPSSSKGRWSLILSPTHLRRTGKRIRLMGCPDNDCVGWVTKITKLWLMCPGKCISRVVSRDDNGFPTMLNPSSYLQSTTLSFTIVLICCLIFYQSLNPSWLALFPMKFSNQQSSISCGREVGVINLLYE